MPKPRSRAPTHRHVLVAIIVAVAAISACDAAGRRAEQALVMRATCVSMIQRAAPMAWTVASAAAAADLQRFALPAGQGVAHRAVDVLVAQCLPSNR
ncbi:MAG: hypothetical protein ACRD0G_15525 [Acidimicrobiales bacterium]